MRELSVLMNGEMVRATLAGVYLTTRIVCAILYLRMVSL